MRKFKCVKHEIKKEMIKNNKNNNFLIPDIWYNCIALDTRSCFCCF